MPSTFTLYPQVVSRTFASFQAAVSSIYPVQGNISDGFDFPAAPCRISAVVEAWLFSLFRVARHGPCLRSLAVVL